MTQPPNHGVTLVTIGTAVYSFFGTTLLIVQWTAAAISIVLGSIALVRALRKPK